MVMLYSWQAQFKHITPTTQSLSTLSPVNHKELYHDFKKKTQKTTSLCLLVIVHASHQTTNSLNSTKSVPTQIYATKHIRTSNTKLLKIFFF